LDADRLDLKITGHVVTPGRVPEDGWIGVRGEIVAGLGPAVGSVLAEAADRTGRPYLQLPSHAGHDANQMAKIGPIGMLFAPSRDGRGHCPEEWTEPDDIAVCLAALAAAVVRLDEELAP
jgi:acetylornithine deacetylase/succinyl-diaminopimelate desuccinylase-like protein